MSFLISLILFISGLTLIEPSSIGGRGISDEFGDVASDILCIPQMTGLHQIPCELQGGKCKKGKCIKGNEQAEKPVEEKPVEEKPVEEKPVKENPSTPKPVHKGKDYSCKSFNLMVWGGPKLTTECFEKCQGHCNGNVCICPGDTPPKPTPAPSCDLNKCREQSTMWKICECGPEKCECERVPIIG